MYSGTYRAVGPGLKRAVVARLDGLDGHVLVPIQRGHDRGLIGERDPVVGVRGEEALEERSGGVEDGGALTADLDADRDLGEVNEIGVNTTDMGGRRWVEVELTKVLAKLVCLDL